MTGQPKARTSVQQRPPPFMHSSSLQNGKNVINYKPERGLVSINKELTTEKMKKKPYHQDNK